jgi:hypothetical protein
MNRPYPSLRRHLGIPLEGLKKTTEILSEASPYPGRDSKRAFLKYVSESITTSINLLGSIKAPKEWY